jgi:importin-11
MFDLRLNVVAHSRSHNDIGVSAPGTRAIAYLDCHVRAFGKLFRKMQQSSTSRFVLLPGCSTLIMYYWGKVVEANRAPEYLSGMSPFNRYTQRVEHLYFSDDIQSLYPTPVLLQGMVLFKDALSQWAPNRKGSGPDIVTGQISSFRPFST